MVNFISPHPAWPFFWLLGFRRLFLCVNRRRVDLRLVVESGTAHRAPCHKSNQGMQFHTQVVIPRAEGTIGSACWRSLNFPVLGKCARSRPAQSVGWYVVRIQQILGLGTSGRPMRSSRRLPTKRAASCDSEGPHAERPRPAAISRGLRTSHGHCSIRAEVPVYLLRPRGTDCVFGPLGHHGHVRGHLPGDQHSCRLGDLAVHRPWHAGNGAARLHLQQYSISSNVNGIKDMETRRSTAVSVPEVYFQPDVNLDLAIAQIVSATNSIRALMPARHTAADRGAG